MVAKSAKPSKRVPPLSVTIYFSDDQRYLYDEIQQTAKSSHQSVSNICAMSLNMGFPVIHNALKSVQVPKGETIMPVSKRKVKRT